MDIISTEVRTIIDKKSEKKAYLTRGLCIEVNLKLRFPTNITDNYFQLSLVRLAPVCFSSFQFCQVQSSPVQSSQVKSSPVQSSPVKSSPVQSSPVQSSPVQSSPVQSSPVQSSPVRSSQVQSGPVQFSSFILQVI